MRKKKVPCGREEVEKKIVKMERREQLEEKKDTKNKKELEKKCLASGF